MKLTRRSPQLVINENLKTYIPWKTLNICTYVRQCQLGRTGQLISLINFSLKTVKSFIKDLHTVCQNSVRSQRRATYSEWTYGSAEHEKFLVSLELKIDENSSQVKWETGHPFLPKVSPTWHVRALNVMISWKPEKVSDNSANIVPWRKQLLFSDYKIMVCDDVTIGISRSDSHYRQ